MNLSRTWPLLLLLYILLPAEARSQYAQDQPKSLKGIKVVRVNFAEPNAKMDTPLRQAMFDAAILELRKSGLRVIREDSDTTAADALLNLTVGIVTGLADFVQVRMDVEQKVVLVRTNEPLQLVTWYHEDAVQQGSWRTTANPMVSKAINKFISDWLDANNR